MHKACIFVSAIKPNKNIEIMTGIQCRSGHVFSMINDNYKDAEWKLQECYYKAQGCEVVTDENLRFSNSETLCSHCESLEHEYESLIEEIKEQI